MRQKFPVIMKKLTKNDDRVVTLLNEIGVYAFQDLMTSYPDRVCNLGIMEQTSISIAAGLSLAGLIPVFHTIAPFIVERGYEQLKDDFGYQNINGNFVSVGASYDYSGLGATHYCPGDIGALKQIPNMQVIIPGTADEFDILLTSEYANGKPTYYRLSEISNKESREVEYGKAMVVKKGNLGTVIAVGTLLDRVVEATKDIDATVLYYTTVLPFDSKTLVMNTRHKKILLCEPYYYGGLTNEIVEAFEGEPVSIKYAGIPHKILSDYGSIKDIDEELGLTVKGINKLAVELFLEDNNG